MVLFCSIALEPCYFQWCQTHRPQGCESLTTTEGFIPFSVQTWIGHLNRLARFSRGGPLWSTTGGRQAGARKALLTCFCSRILTQRWKKHFWSWAVAGRSALLSDSSFGAYVGAAHRGCGSFMAMALSGQNQAQRDISLCTAAAWLRLTAACGVRQDWARSCDPGWSSPLSQKSTRLKWNCVISSISL